VSITRTISSGSGRYVEMVRSLLEMKATYLQKYDGHSDGHKAFINTGNSCHINEGFLNIFAEVVCNG
jgi:hypothetical protein